MEEITRLLARLAQSDGAAKEALFAAAYSDLRKLAAAHMRGQPSAQALHTTALVHEAYLRLASGLERDWEGRAHFFRQTSAAMRSVLVDHARRIHADKRAARVLPIEFAADEAAIASTDVAVLDLHDALVELEDIDPAKAEIVQLMAFGGLPLHEVAATVGRPLETVRRHWRLARNWLRVRLASERDDD